MILRFATGAILVLLATACSGSSQKPAGAGDRIVVSIKPATPPEKLPQGTCFVGVHSYDVMLLGENLGADGCARLADRLFPAARQFPWSPKELLSDDSVQECELSLMRAHLVITRGDPDMEGPRFDRAYDLSERACHRLEHEGWKVIFQER